MTKTLIILIFCFLLSFESQSFELENCINHSSNPIKVIETEPPRFPSHLSAYPEGWVKLRIQVDHNGNLIKSDIISSHPKRLFDKSAKKSVKKWKFSKSKETKIRCGIITIEFKLEK